MDSPRPVFGFGGSVFNAYPHLRSSVSGVFMGENAREALTSVRMSLGAPKVRDGAKALQGLGHDG
jgi:hypothetical protein